MKQLFLIGCFFIFLESEGQKNSKYQADFVIQPLSIKEGSKKSAIETQTKFYIPVDYDFADSITISLNNVFLGSFKLKYVEPDSAISYFPHNRMLLGFDRKKRKGNCLIKFHYSNRMVLFRIHKKYIFYHLEISDETKIWNLAMLNSLPWPN